MARAIEWAILSFPLQNNKGGGGGGAQYRLKAAADPNPNFENNKEDDDGEEDQERQVVKDTTMADISFSVSVSLCIYRWIYLLVYKWA